MYQYYFEKLDVWNRSMDLSVKVYQFTKTLPHEEKYGIVSQLNRAIVSVSCNLVEGLSRQTPKDQARFTTYSYGSLMESLNLIILCQQLQLINNEKYQELRLHINEVANKLNALRKSQLSKIKN